MKKTICLLVCLLCFSLAAVAMDDIDVDCGRFGGIICSEWELDEEFDEVTGYVSDNEEAWSKDEVGGGGGGMSSAGLGRYLMGDRDLFDSYESYYQWELERFALKEYVDARMDRLEAMILLGSEATETEILFKAGLIKSARTGKPESVDGYVCNAKLDMCIKVTEV